MPITDPPIPPDDADPVNFSPRAVAWNNWIKGTFRTELNALEANVEDRSDEADDAAAAALASQNAAATSAGQADLSEAAAAVYAAAALAAAAATQAGLPAQTSTSGKVLRSEQGVALWGSERRAATQIAHSASSENEISNSSAVNRASWTKGSNTGTLGLDQTTPGPNGLRSVTVPNTGSGSQFVSWNYTPQVGVARTLSLWWKGASKPASGNLLQLTYRDAGDAIQYATLAFSDASVVADGKWRRYSVTATHQGATVTALPAYACVDTGTATLSIADPQIDPAASSAGTYVATGANHLLEPDCNYDVSTATGSVGLLLPDTNLGVMTGTCIGIKDYGRAAATNNIVIARNGALIEDAANDVEFDINGAAIALQFTARKGWLIK